MKYLNKKIIFFILVVVILITFNLLRDKSYENTLKPMFIYEKGFDSDYKKFYFKAKMFESTSSSPIETIKILVSHKNTCNLITLNKAYLVGYNIHTDHNELTDIFYDQSFEDTYKSVFYND